MKINVGHFLTRRARRNPNGEALYEPAGGRRFSYAELSSRADRVGHALAGLGLDRGDRVGLLLMNGAEFTESFFGAGKAGFCNVPLNWRLVPDELEFILADAGAKVLIYSGEFAEAVAELRRRGDATHVQHWIQVGGDLDDGVVDYDDWIAAASDGAITVDVGDDDLLFIMYTSGTTGLPKGVIHTHDTVMWGILTVAATADFRMDDRYLNSLPMFHVGALTPMLACVYGGVSLTVMRAFDPVESWRLIGEERITTSLMVPAMLQFMLAVRDPEAHDASTLRWVMSGAAPVPVSLIKQYQDLGIEIHQVYGLTESCGPACLISSEDALSRAGSTGPAFFHTDVRVVRSDGSDCDPGEAGEVLVAGHHVMVGYWNRPEATAETVVDGWLHTGDVAVMDEDGFVTIVDRIKDMLISGGENVYPAEIENVLLAHPAVADAGVIGIPSAKWGESPLAVVVPKPDTEVSADEIMAHTRDHLAAFKTVKAVEFVSEVPRNPSGKILKRELREQFSYDAPE